MHGKSYFRYWGKANAAESSSAAFHLLPYHCLDVAAVGTEFLRRAPTIRTFLADVLGIPHSSNLEGWVAFWLALHDLGKFSEAFQGQRTDLVHLLQSYMPRTQYVLRHDSLGMLFWKSVLLDRCIDQQWFGAETEEFAEELHWWMRSVTGHHGQPPIERIENLGHHCNIALDTKAIVDFVSDVRALLLDNSATSIPGSIDRVRFEHASKALSWWIAGIAVLADWVGSNTDFFPYRSDYAMPMLLEKYWEHTRAQAKRALDRVGVLPPERQSPVGLSELFPYIETPSPLQSWASTTRLSHGPQLHLLEDVTGAGKTEAAVMLAHRLMSEGCADGFFIGLPTMATANAMYERIATVYQRLFAGDASLVLAHGQRNLVEAFAYSVLPAGSDEEDRAQQDDTATARCTAWLADHNKRALLAPAGVGTLDQALLAVLHSRHQSLRLLGLFRKVLIVDEVHACDRYMQSLLERLLEFHAAAGGSAILLSATLPQRMKQSLLNAFARGRGCAAPDIAADAYPLVSSWHSLTPNVLIEEHIPTRLEVERHLHVRYVSELDQIIEGIDEALRSGKCVCWVRNTIADAVAAYETFKHRMPTDRLHLFHARFALEDRLNTEQIVLRHFGKNSGPDERSGRLVIATQVVEQSLDADWDVVVSDLAPIDRLIQRAGRLHRHPRDAKGRRLTDSKSFDERGHPCLWVYGPTWNDTPSADWFKAVFPKAAHVYPNHAELWLTARLLQHGVIAMPDDARSAIEAVFGGDHCLPSGLQSSADKAEGQGYSDASVAQQNTIKLATGYTRGGFDWWSEAHTPSRLGEASTTVLLAKWDGDVLKPWSKHPDSHHAWAYSAVKVAERLIAQTATPDTPARRDELERVMEALPNKGQWAVLLPLKHTEHGWVGEALSKAGDKRPPRILRWAYDPKKGLLQENANDGEEE